MDTLNYSIRKLISALPMLFGVTLIAFVLMVYFGPDRTYISLSKNPTAEEIAQVRHQLGYDRPFIVRYAQFVREIVTFDFGHSDSSGEKVITILKRTLPVSIKLALPGFILGNALGIILGLISAYFRGRPADRIIMAFAVFGMSISFLIVLIAFQYIFCSSFGLDWFPVQGWSTGSFGAYLKYITVPTMATVFVALGYNTRFYRAVIVDEMERDHVRTARAYGVGPVELMLGHVLKNAMIPIITRIIFTIPFLIIGGSLLVEQFFGIPGVGYVTYNAITTGDLPITKAVVTCATILYVAMLVLVDILYLWVDPRISLK